ncbi:unnamed protein product [Coregonus sp. 'balchen']|nr:unnamed protein product [Coregonus sp. 'balchen']
MGSPLFSALGASTPKPFEGICDLWLCWPSETKACPLTLPKTKPCPVPVPLTSSSLPKPFREPGFTGTFIGERF